MDEQLRSDARRIFDAAVASVQASALLARFDAEAALGRPLSAFRSIQVAAAGKAAAAMAAAFEARFAEVSFTGTATVPHGYADSAPPLARIALNEAGHPEPDENGAEAARQVLAAAASLQTDDLLVVLLSGGSSALWTLPLDGLTLLDARHTNRIMLRAGMAIAEVNAVRRGLTRLSGGRLAAAAYPAQTLALVLSDVEGDDLSVVGSGPTVASNSETPTAETILHSAGVWDALPEAVQRAVARHSQRRQTPRPSDVSMSLSEAVLVGSNATALDAAEAEALRLGYRVVRDRPFMKGEAREVGFKLGRRVAAWTGPRPACLLWGGETTVTVRGGGKGGRNQEMALAAALSMKEAPGERLLLCAGTDGRDGPTDAAGAFAEPHTLQRARDTGAEAGAYLERNDAYSFFSLAGGLLRTGPTHTNVMDIAIGLVR